MLRDGMLWGGRRGAGASRGGRNAQELLSVLTGGFTLRMNMDMGNLDTDGIDNTDSTEMRSVRRDGDWRGGCRRR